jgi:hypothetical protein
MTGKKIGRGYFTPGNNQPLAFFVLTFTVHEVSAVVKFIA